MSTIFSSVRPAGKRMGYLEIAAAVELSIRSGRLSAGERLPTQREVARELGIAIGTVTRAYSEIERRGLVVGHVGRGTYVRAEADRFGGAEPHDPSIIDMTISRPPPEGAARHFANALRLLSKRADLIELLGTEPPNGWPRHRAAIAKWIPARGNAVDPHHVIICNGVQHALSVILSAFTRAGDVVATEALNYSGIKLLGDLHRVRLAGVRMDSHGMRADDLEQVCRAESVKFVLCSPTVHNPTTVSMSPQRRHEIADLSRRYGFVVIENDILGMLPSEPTVPIHAISAQRTIYVTGLTKVTAAGMRLGFIVASPSLLQPLMSGVRSTTWMPSPLTLEIFTRWVEDGSIEEIVAWHRGEIAARWALAKAALGKTRLLSGPCAYHVWLGLPQAWNPDDFVSEAHHLGVALSPSDIFALDPDAAPNAVRISLGFPNSKERLQDALRILGSLLDRRPQDSARSTGR